jgi:hypothetical protein
MAAGQRVVALAVVAVAALVQYLEGYAAPGPEGSCPERSGHLLVTEQLRSAGVAAGW